MPVVACPPLGLSVGVVCTVPTPAVLLLVKDLVDFRRCCVSRPWTDRMP
jgi:hypothetical protein